MEAPCLGAPGEHLQISYADKYVIHEKYLICYSCSVILCL